MDVKSILLTALAGGMAAASLPLTLAAAEPEQADVTTAKPHDYRFRRAKQTKSIEPYSTTLFSADRNDVYTLRGEQLHATKDSIAVLKVNPAGINFGVVTFGKKGSKAEIYSALLEDVRVMNFDTKRYGQPTAMTYAPDARSVIVAAGDRIYFLDTRKYEPFAKIQNVSITPRNMVTSPNGYFLAASEGDRVVIYNMEDRTVRKTLNIGEKVNDMAFNPESSEFAVLTDDGVLSLYNTRTFDLRKMVDNLGQGLACAYNFDGKYVAVVMNPNNIAVVNLLLDSDREYHENEVGGITDVSFFKDSFDNTLMGYNTTSSIDAKRMPHLKPYYNKLIDDEVGRKMDEWLKMMPGETMDEYKARVTEESRMRQRRLFEDEIATDFAGNLLAGATMSLGSYDRANGVLAINFDSMPTIYLPVPESDVTSFHNAGDLTLTDVQYGVMPDDTFEIVYAKVTNAADGKTYVYDNLMRAEMDYMAADDAISLELLQQQQMEEIKLQEVREKVINEAKSMNVISDHTNIQVDSKVVPDYDSNGNKILNYQVNFSYNVEPEFSAVEDFGPGKYHVAESGAASSMLNIVKEAFEGDFKQYLGSDKKMKVRLLGTADATPIMRTIPYDGSYGDFADEPVYIDGQLTAVSVDAKGGIKENPQLAFLRAMGVRDYLEKNVQGFKDMNTDYRYEVNVSKDKGSEHRRITLELLFVDAY
mgnify:FL=1|jgi:hypothetical protein